MTTQFFYTKDVLANALITLKEEADISEISAMQLEEYKAILDEHAIDSFGIHFFFSPDEKEIEKFVKENEKYFDMELRNNEKIYLLKEDAFLEEVRAHFRSTVDYTLLATLIDTERELVEIASGIDKKLAGTNEKRM